MNNALKPVYANPQVSLHFEPAHDNGLFGALCRPILWSGVSALGPSLPSPGVAAGEGGGHLRMGELSRGHIKGKVGVLSPAQLSLVLPGERGSCPLPEAAPHDTCRQRSVMFNSE